MDEWRTGSRQAERAGRTGGARALEKVEGVDVAAVQRRTADEGAAQPDALDCAAGKEQRLHHQAKNQTYILQASPTILHRHGYHYECQHG
eukprot:SAG11_NODE_3802_length_2216_cov_1.075579_2_plen_90_part_00